MLFVFMLISVIFLLVYLYQVFSETNDIISLLCLFSLSFLIMTSSFKMFLFVAGGFALILSVLKKRKILL